MCLSTLEILANIRPEDLDQAAGPEWRGRLDLEFRQTRRQLIGMARALQTGATERLQRTSETNLPDLGYPIPVQLTGYHLLMLQLASNIDGLQQRLAKTAKRWKI
jgi:hypothetical protein